MKRTRFTEKQVVGVLKEAKAGAKTAELTRRAIYGRLSGASDLIRIAGELALPTASSSHYKSQASRAGDDI